MMLLTADIEVPAGQTDSVTFRVILRIMNQTDRTIAILNSDMGVPSSSMNWPYSNEIYQTSLLISFGYLSISVTNEMGKELPQQAIETWATPVLQPNIEIRPGDSFELVIPIGSFYQLATGRIYLVLIEYGEQDLKVVARANVV